MTARKPSPGPPPERRCRLLLRLTSPRTWRMGGEAGLPWAKAPPARLAASRVPHPLSWQRAARPHACAPVSRSCSLLAAPSCAPVSAAAPPQRLQLNKSFCISLFKLSSSLQQLSSRLHSSPPAQLQPCQLPVPSHPSCPCAAVRAGGLPAACSAGQPLARGVRADPRCGQQRAGWQQGGRTRSMAKAV